VATKLIIKKGTMTRATGDMSKLGHAFQVSPSATGKNVETPIRSFMFHHMSFAM